MTNFRQPQDTVSLYVAGEAQVRKYTRDIKPNFIMRLVRQLKEYRDYQRRQDLMMSTTCGYGNKSSKGFKLWK